jgi:hypothetical protein
VIIVNDNFQDLNFLEDVKVIIENFKDYGILNSDIYCFLLKSNTPTYFDYNNQQFEGKIIRCFTEEEYKRKIARIVYIANLSNADIIYYTIGRDGLNRFDIGKMTKNILSRDTKDYIFVEYKTKNEAKKEEVKNIVKTKGFNNLLNIGRKYGLLNKSIGRFLKNEKNKGRSNEKLDVEKIKKNVENLESV